jgi:diguanylate cyclase (GGDEF)-like protein/PAS domain S-box-containing protein
MEASRVGTLELDRNGICVYINTAAARALGYEPQELVGKDFHAAVHYRKASGEVYLEKECPMNSALSSGESCLSGPDEVFWSKDGRMVPSGYTGDPILEQGEVQGLVVNFLDLSPYERVREEAERNRGFVEVLKRVGLAVNTANNVQEALELMLDEVIQRFGYVVGHAYFKSLEGQTRHVWQSRIRIDEDYRKLSEKVFEEQGQNPTPNGIVGRAMATRRPAWTVDVDLEGAPVRSKAMRLMGLRSGIACPIMSRNEVVGLFELESLQAGAPPVGLSDLLFDIGVQMGRAIERVQAQEKLQASEAVLRTRVEELERLHSEMRLINEIGNLLDGARSQEEVSGVLSEYGARLFADCDGDLSLGEEDGEEIRRMAHWGQATSKESFASLECWALRRGRIHETQADSQLRCAHIMVAGGWDLCVPMQAHRGTLGMLHLHGSQARSEVMASRRQLALNMAEHVSLALVNFDLRERLRYQAFHDPLTGLYNLRHMEETLVKEIAEAERSGSDLALIEIDIDFFKSFNDDFGHDFGDEALRTLARFLEHRIREQDTLCRVGGEEFMLLMPDTTLSVALERAEQIRVGVSELRARRESDVRKITISVGVAAYPEHGREYGDLMRSVDEALYASKRTGRNRVVVADKPIRSE